jgi:hypothetical protein
MPIMVLRLEYNKSEETRQPVTLESHVIPHQHIRLLSYQVRLKTVDPDLDVLYINLPFLDSKDNITHNLPRRGIPLYVDRNTNTTFKTTQYDFFLYDFVPKKLKSWNVYDVDGAEYTEDDYTIELIFGIQKVTR